MYSTYLTDRYSKCFSKYLHFSAVDPHLHPHDPSRFCYMFVIQSSPVWGCIAIFWYFPTVDSTKVMPWLNIESFHPNTSLCIRVWSKYFVTWVKPTSYTWLYGGLLLCKPSWDVSQWKHVSPISNTGMMIVKLSLSFVTWLHTDLCPKMQTVTSHMIIFWLLCVAHMLNAGPMYLCDIWAVCLSSASVQHQLSIFRW